MLFGQYLVCLFIWGGIAPFFIITSSQSVYADALHNSWKPSKYFVKHISKPLYVANGRFQQFQQLLSRSARGTSLTITMSVSDRHGEGVCDHQNQDCARQINSTSSLPQFDGEASFSHQLSNAPLNSWNKAQKVMSSTVSNWLKIAPNELHKVLSLSALLFSIIYVFVLTRDTKDTLIVTNCGAEAIAFLKVYGVIPAATLFMLLYSNLVISMDPNKIFRFVIMPFLIFFCSFGFFVYPMRHYLHDNACLLSILQKFGLLSGRLSVFGNIFRHWTFALYFVASELWGSVMVALLFWIVANDIVKLEEAKRMYPIITFLGNLSPLFSGFTLAGISAVARKIVKFAGKSAGTVDDAAFAWSLKVVSVVIGLMGWLILYLQRHVTSTFSGQRQSSTPSVTEFKSAAATAVPLRQKPKLSIRDSLRVLVTDPGPLRYIAVMVFSYGMSIECSELVWKSVVHRALPDRTDYLAFMGRYSVLTGIASAVLMPLGRWLLQSFGWVPAALFTPQVMALLSIPFYGSIYWAKGRMPGSLNEKKWWLIAVYVGLIQHVVTKAAKYTIFDPIKEIAYIPLDASAKTTGKAAIEVLGAKFGKSSGALMQQMLVLLCGGLLPGVPVISMVQYIVVAVWSRAVWKLAPFVSADKPSGTRPIVTKK